MKTLSVTGRAWRVAPFHYLILVLNGYSRYTVGWGLRESMTERDLEIVVKMARDAFPNARP